MDLKRILVAVDTTKGRDAAFARALSLARASGAELYVLHAVRANQSFSTDADQRLDRTRELRARADDAGVRVHSVEQHGDPADIIELHANARAVDLIVLGSEPRASWCPRRRSPIAERVLRRTRRPTLVVAGDKPETESGFRHVLVAVDLSAGSESLVSSAIALTAGDLPRVTVMHTVTGLEAAGAVRNPARWMVPEYRTYVLEDAQRDLERLVSAVPADVNAQVRIATGPAAQAILEQSADVDADLIVVGKSRGFRPLGSTAVRVLRKHDRSLLVLPTTDAGSTTQVHRDRAA